MSFSGHSVKYIYFLKIYLPTKIRSSFISLHDQQSLGGDTYIAVENEGHYR